MKQAELIQRGPSSFARRDRVLFYSLLYEWTENCESKQGWRRKREKVGEVMRAGWEQSFSPASKLNTESCSDRKLHGVAFIGDHSA